MNPFQSRILAAVLSLTALSAVAFGQAGMQPAAYGHRGGFEEWATTWSSPTRSAHR